MASSHSRLIQMWLDPMVVAVDDDDDGGDGGAYVVAVISPIRD